MTKTLKVECVACGKWYRASIPTTEKIKEKLKTQPDYLSTYKCNVCSGSPVKQRKTTPKQEKAVKIKISLNAKDYTQDKFLAQFIPKECPEYINRTIGGVKDNDLIAYFYNQKDKMVKNLLFIGETGTGKSLSVKRFCYENKIPYYRLVMNGGTAVEDIVGQNVMDNEGKIKFAYQVLLHMMERGGVFVFDEINAGGKELLHLLNGITDFERRVSVTQHTGEVINACDEFLAVACCNPPDEYDLQALSHSLKSRFCTFRFNYDDGVDRKLINDKALLGFAKDIRMARANKKLDTPLSTRDLVQFIKLREDLGYPLAKEMILAKFTNGEVEVVREILENYMEKGKVMDGGESQ